MLAQHGAHVERIPGGVLVCTLCRRPVEHQGGPCEPLLTPQPAPVPAEGVWADVIAYYRGVASPDLIADSLVVLAGRIRRAP